MALIGEIRKRPKVLIAIIGLALLAFLITDFWKNQDTVNTNNYGEVNGETVTREDYDNSLAALNQQYQGQYPENLLKQQAWNSAVQNKIVEQHFNDAGFTMDDEVLFAYFPDLTKQIETLKKQAAEGNKEALNALNNNVPQVLAGQKTALINQIYSSLLNASTLTNKLEVKNMLANASKTADVDFVKIDYNKYHAKNPVTVTDEQIQAYINKHPLRFKREASTTFQYAFFKNDPSATDNARFTKNLNAILNGGVEVDEDGEVLDSIASFRNATADSIYVANYSQEPYIPGFRTYQELQQYFSPEIANWAKSASAGAVFGPYDYRGNGTLKNAKAIAKLTATKAIDSIEIKHILIGYKGSSNSQATRSQEAAKKLADEILAQVKANPTTFAQFVATQSEDPSASQNGGTFWTTKGNKQFVPEFQQYAENNSAGSLGVVETDFGYHVMNVSQKKSGVGFKIANVVKENRASKASEDVIFDKANKFLTEVKGKTLDNFVATAKKANLTDNEAKNIERFAGNIQGLGTDKDEEIISWTFDKNNQVGDTNIFTTTDGDYIVVRLTSKAEKGQATPNSVRTEVEPLVRSQIITEQLQAKVKGKSLDQVATEFESVKESATLNAAQYVIPTAGQEPKVVGKVFGMKANTKSSAIEGKSGAFVVQVKAFGTSEQKPTADQVKQQLQGQSRQTSSAILQSLRLEADVNDNRGAIFK